MWMLTLTLPTIRGKAIPEMFYFRKAIELFGTIESTQHCGRTYGLNDAIPPKDVFFLHQWGHCIFKKAK